VPHVEELEDRPVRVIDGGNQTGRFVAAEHPVVLLISLRALVAWLSLA